MQLLEYQRVSQFVRLEVGVNQKLLDLGYEIRC